MKPLNNEIKMTTANGLYDIAHVSEQYESLQSLAGALSEERRANLVWMLQI